MKYVFWASALAICMCYSGPLWAEAVNPVPRLDVDMRIPLSILAAYCDDQLKSVATILELVADSPQAQSGNWEQIKPVLKEAQAKRPVGAFWFAQPDGTYFTTEKDRIDQKLNERPYFPVVMGGQVSIGNLVVGRSTQHNVAIVAVPIKTQSRVIGMLGASVELGQMSRQINELMHLPPNMVFYAVDANGVVALHSEQNRIFLETLALGGQVAEALKKMVQTQEGQLSYEFDNTQRELVYQASPLTGWRFALGRFKPIPKVDSRQ